MIGGNFDFWQRGTSGSSSGAGTYVADRFKMAKSATYTITQSQSTDVPTIAQSGFQSRYSYLATNGTGTSPGAGDYAELQYLIEGQNYAALHGRKFRFQFWVKTSVSGTYTVTFSNAAATRTYLTSFSIGSANTWTKIALDASADTTGTWNFDNTAGLLISFNLTAGSSLQASTLNTWTTNGSAFGLTGQTQWGATTGATFQIAQVMLIPQDFTQAGASNVDVPFQRAGRTIGQELQFCQRYCNAFGFDSSVNGHVFGVGQCFSTVSIPITIPNPVNMRAVPVLSSFTSAASNFVATSASGSSIALTSMSLGSQTNTAVTDLAGVVASGLVAGNASFISRATGNTTAIIVVDSEL